MSTTYHLSSAQDLTNDILEEIKVKFQSKSITIIVEEAELEYELNSEEKALLDQRLKENKENYLSSNESISILKTKYGV
ncbi:hypothetical protein V7S79_06720 [Aquirufa sp. ROCK-SH2]